jgi:predicted PurR-regulated permease PerM
MEREKLFALERRKDREPRSLYVPMSTFMHFVVAAIAIWASLQLLELAGLIFVSILLAVTFEKIVSRAEGKWISRRMAIGFLALSIFMIMGAVFFLLLPSLVTEMQGVAGKLPQIRNEIQGHLPSGWIGRQAESIWAHPEKLTGEMPAKVLAAGAFLLTAVAKVGVALVFAFYFLIEGERTFDWVVTFFRPQNQRKLREAGTEISNIISAYVVGQVITSVSIAIFTAILLSSLGVPGALPLAMVAAILDVIPAIGVTLSIFAAVLLALSVSATTALWVGLAYLVYQAIENYFIAPIVYGNRMRVSSLVVLLSVTVGGILGGAIGVIIALPVAAAYPVAERVWLRKYLGDRVVDEHKKIEKEETDSVLPKAAT